MYSVNDEKFTSFFAAIAAASKIGAEVFEVETGLSRWAPAPKANAKKAVRHILVKNDGTEVEIGRVLQ